MTRTFGMRLFLILTPLMAVAAEDEAPSLATPDGTENSLPVSSVAEADDGEPRFVLRYQFRTGEVLRYRSEQIEEQCSTVGGQTKTDLGRTEQVRRFEVSRIDDSGQANLVMQYESVEMSRQVDDGAPVVFRSSMKPSQVPREFAGLADSLRKNAPRFAVMPTGTPLNENEEIILRQTDDSPETRLMQPLPKDPVRTGETWKYFTRVKLRVAKGITREVRLLTTCRLESVENGMARIQFTTSPAIRLKSALAMSQLVAAQPRGHCLMDLQAGRITKRVTRNNNSVFGVAGAKSFVSYSSEMIEELLTEEASVSQH